MTGCKDINMYYKISTKSDTYYTNELGIIGARDYFLFLKVPHSISEVEQLPNNMVICDSCLYGRIQGQPCICEE